MSDESVRIRTHEREQLQDFVLDARDTYEELGEESDMFADRVDVMEDLYDVFSFEEEEYEMERELWKELVVGLEHVDDTRAQWLRSKIAKRVGLGPGKQGFTTRIPVGHRMSA